MNEQQRKVFDMVSNNDQKLSLIWGPPGTGKTTTIAKVVVGCILSGSASTALIMAPTNSAADALALKVVEEMKSTKCGAGFVRIFASHFKDNDVIEGLKEHMFIWHEEGFENLQNKSIICCTIGTATMRFENLMEKYGKFDIAIYDEAGRISIAESIPPLLLTDRVVFCGDHKQLRPYVPTEFGFLQHLHWDISILELLMDLGHPYVQLAINYRSVQQILDPSNVILYRTMPLQAGADGARRAEATYYFDKFEFLADFFSKEEARSIGFPG